MSILLRIVPPFLIRWCNLLAGRAVGQPHSTIQKNVKKFGRFKKNTFLCSVTNIKNMKTKEIYWVSNPSFNVGKKYKVVFNDSVSIELCTTLKEFAKQLSENSSDDEEAIHRFVIHCAVYLLIPLQVCLVPNFLKD